MTIFSYMFEYVCILLSAILEQVYGCFFYDGLQNEGAGVEW